MFWRAEPAPASLSPSTKKSRGIASCRVETTRSGVLEPMKETETCVPEKPPPITISPNV